MSGAIFKEGRGYGYSVGRPGEVKMIKAGQAMIVISPDQPPVIKPATDLEIEQLVEDTAPPEEGEAESEPGSEPEPNTDTGANTTTTGTRATTTGTRATTDTTTLHSAGASRHNNFEQRPVNIIILFPY